MAKVLSSFSITAEADGYVLYLEDEDGETTEFSATLDQLDELIALAAADDRLDILGADSFHVDQRFHCPHADVFVRVTLGEPS